MFNTLQYTKVLEAAGVSRQQAEAHVQVMAQIIEGDVATKQDLKEFEYRLTIKLAAILGGILTLAIGIMTILMKLR